MDINPEFPVHLEEEAGCKRYLIRIFTLNRKEQKTFCTSPSLQETIKKAKLYGCEGNVILLAADGCEICDDDAFIFYIARGEKFMLANSASEWQPLENPSRHCIAATYSADMLHRSSSTLVKRLHEKPLSTQQLVDVVDQVECERHTNSAKALLAEEKFKNVDVPWAQIPLDIREALAKGQPLEHKVNVLCNLIVHELRAVSVNIPIRVMRQLSHRLVSRYPKSFQKPGQTGDLLPMVLNLALAMRHHNNYLNRADNESEWQDYVEDE